MEQNKSVTDYKRDTELKILRGQCLNISAVLLQRRDYTTDAYPSEVFILARKLFEEADNVDFLNWCPSDCSKEEKPYVYPKGHKWEGMTPQQVNDGYKGAEK